MKEFCPICKQPNEIDINKEKYTWRCSKCYGYIENRFPHLLINTAKFDMHEPRQSCYVETPAERASIESNNG